MPVKSLPRSARGFSDARLLQPQTNEVLIPAMREITEEDVEKIEDAKKNPDAYDPDARLHEYFGVHGIPHAILVDAAGTVVWRGHPARLGS